MGKPPSWSQKRTLVTGATGFIGQYLVGRLRDMGAQVYAGSSPTSAPIQPTPVTDKTPHAVYFDVRDDQAVGDIVEHTQPQVVFHLAAIGVTNPRVNPIRALMVNAGGTINLLEALKETEVERVVLVGTSYEYGASGHTKQVDPFNAYAASKVAAWAFGRMYWRAFELPLVFVRPFQVYGPGQPEHRLIAAAMRAATSGEDFPMTPGEQERDFVFAPDVANGMIAAAHTAGLEGTSLDLGTGVGVTVRSVVEQIWELAGAEGSVQPGALPYRTGAAVHLIADADRTAQLTGWRATTTLVEGLRTTIRHWKAQER